MEYAERVRGAVLGGALADALAAQWSAEEAAGTGNANAPTNAATPVHAADPGNTAPENAATAANEPGAEPAEELAFSARTGICLYTMDALIELFSWANQGVAADDAACLWLAYLRWYQSYTGQLPEGIPVIPPRPIDQVDGPHRRFGADALSLEALATATQGHPKRPLHPEAAAPAPLTRTFPVGLVPFVPVTTLISMAAKAAALTHGNSDALAAPMLLCAAVREVHEKSCSLAEAFSPQVLSAAETLAPAGQQVSALVAAVRTSWANGQDPAQALTPGEAGVVPPDAAEPGEDAGQTLAWALAYALRASTELSPSSYLEHIRCAVQEQPNHPVVAVLTGQLLGLVGGGSIVAEAQQLHSHQPLSSGQQQLVADLLEQWLATMA